MRRVLPLLMGCALPAGVVYAEHVYAEQAVSIFDYIRQAWKDLTRSHRNLAAAAEDLKFPAPASGRWPVYLPSSEDLSSVQTRLRAEMAEADFSKIDIRPLPRDLQQIHEQGLLYLPRPYVVPGGRFNEMYGWDSYFIQMGLLRDGQIELAKDMADNALYEVREYGKVLNANRTYYLTRSQPPFLTEMVLAVYNQTKDRAWLEESWPAIEQYYRYWTTEPHLTPETGLSRYYDLGEGPSPEVVSSEHDSSGRNDYDLIKEYFRSHRIPDYDAAQYYDAGRDELTPLFYKGDRSMRESGFDPSSRFGPFSVDIIHYDPVCLNTLLYLMEVQAGEIMGTLGRQAEEVVWRQRAEQRAVRINRLMWDQAGGFYFDYDFVHARVRRYPFLTTFYPLWAGIASPDQAARVVRNLHVFEQAGGLQTSPRQTGDQWDAPFGWAPLQWIALEALRRYGYRSQADRVAEKFLSLIQQEFVRHGTLEEKYDVVRRQSDVSHSLRYGYRTNEAGFGWTNAVFTGLFDQLPPSDQQRLLQAH
jgi:alpha,alpha-trehalase